MHSDPIPWGSPQDSPTRVGFFFDMVRR
jgi:hypothetical protein